MKRVYCVGVSGLALLIALGASLAVSQQDATAQGRGAAAGGAPVLRVQPLWPQPFPEDYWVVGSITGVATDAQNNVWVVHKGNQSLEANERGMAPTPPGAPSSSVCCFAAPYVLQYDSAGKLLTTFGGPSAGYVWPQQTGGMTVDAKGNVWITAAGTDVAPAAGGRGRGAAAPPAAGAAAAPARGAAPANGAAPAAGAAPPVVAGRGGRGAAAAPEAPPPADAHVLKFDRLGKHLLTIGTPGKTEASNTTLNRPSDVAYDATANEVFVADMGNRRIVVFDADNGTYKRHWYAYGEKAAGADPGPYAATAEPSKSFRDITCVNIARDGNVYVCDKSSNRIQVFDKSGKFVKEAFVAKGTMGGIVSGSFGVINAAGSVWDLTFSSDQAQRFVFVADGQNKKVRVLQRDTLAEVGTIGSGGRYPGTFLGLNQVATDTQGNLYTGETHHGKRVQKFSPAR